MMNLGDNLRDSFEYATKLFSDAGRLIILVVLSVFSLGGLIPIIGWVLLGYEARVLKESPGTGTPPKLEKYGELFVEGAKVYFAAVIYLLIPFILITVGGVSSIAGLMSIQGLEGQFLAPGLLLGGAGLAILLVGIILLILLLVIFHVGLAHMIKTTKFGKAFAFGEIFGIIRGIGWAKYFGWFTIIIVIDALVSAIARIPFVGLIIFIVIPPVFGVFAFRSLGLLYNEGAPPEFRVAAPIITGLACPSCGTPLQPHHKFCPNCGAAAPPPPTAPSGTKFCISCGAKIPATATFCGTCGAKQT